MAARTRKLKLDDKHKDDIAATQLLKILKKHAISSRGKLSASRIAAARVALPFLIPTLSSVDQTLHQPDDALTEDEILAKFKALAETYPDFLQRLLGMLAKAKPGIQDVVVSDDAEAQQPQSKTSGVGS